MASIRKLKKEIAKQVSGDAVREIAKMQMEIDKYRQAICDICLWVIQPGNFTMKSDIDEMALIHQKITELQKENEELKNKLPK